MSKETKKEKWNGQQIKNVLCYIPVVAFVLYFTEDKKSLSFNRHIRYWMILFGVFIVLTIFMRSIFLSLLVLIYIWVSAFLAYKAYIWEDVYFKFIDNIFEEEKTKSKEDELDLDEEEEDVLK